MGSAPALSSGIAPSAPASPAWKWIPSMSRMCGEVYRSAASQRSTSKSLPSSDGRSTRCCRNNTTFLVCSHVLEHLPDPAAFLRRIRKCIKPGGVFVGLVPLNERRANPHHIQICERARIQTWLEEGGLKVRHYVESDPWIYWVQPLFACDTGVRHALAQVVGITLGVPSVLLGHRIWAALSPWCARLTGSKPTQAAFVANRID